MVPSKIVLDENFMRGFIFCEAVDCVASYSATASIKIASQILQPRRSRGFVFESRNIHLLKKPGNSLPASPACGRDCARPNGQALCYKKGKRNMPMATWKTEDLSQLKHLWEFKTASQIGRVLGRTRNAICGKAHRMGLLGGLEKHLHDNPHKVPVRPKKETVVVTKALVPKPKPAPISTDPCLFLELDDNRCKWALGDPMDRVTTATIFCGAEALDGLPYCPDHCRMAFHPTRERSYDRH